MPFFKNWAQLNIIQIFLLISPTQQQKTSTILSLSPVSSSAIAAQGSADQIRSRYLATFETLCPMLNGNTTPESFWSNLFSDFVTWNDKLS